MKSPMAALSQQANPSPTGWLVQVFGRCIALFRHRWQVRRTAELLTTLDDKMLADIGLMRDQVWHVARDGRLPDWR